MAEGHNQRSYYRVNDHALLKVRLIDAAEREALGEDFEGTRLRYSLTTHVSHQRQQRAPLLNQIRKLNPDVATYLAHLEAQLETLSAQLIHELDFDKDARPQPINLSATGMRYESKVELVDGQALEVGLLLQPDQRLVLALGTAVRVVPPTTDTEGGSNGTGCWSVSVSFDRINEEDQELVIKHVHRIQRAELQAARDGKNSTGVWRR